MKNQQRATGITYRDEVYNALTCGLWGIITSWREGEAELREIEEEIRRENAEKQLSEKKQKG